MSGRGAIRHRTAHDGGSRQPAKAASPPSSNIIEQVRKIDAF
jgi:hypothetical protein